MTQSKLHFICVSSSLLPSVLQSPLGAALEMQSVSQRCRHDCDALVICIATARECYKQLKTKTTRIIIIFFDACGRLSGHWKKKRRRKKRGCSAARLSGSTCLLLQDKHLRSRWSLMGLLHQPLRRPDEITGVRWRSGCSRPQGEREAESYLAELNHSVVPDKSTPAIY